MASEPAADAAGSLVRGRRRRRRREEGGCSGGGSGSGMPVGEARPPRNEFLGTPGCRSHEKGTREEVLARGDGAGDGDGDGLKVDEALETEEEDDDEDE